MEQVSATLVLRIMYCCCLHYTPGWIFPLQYRLCIVLHLDVTWQHEQRPADMLYDTLYLSLQYHILVLWQVLQAVPETVQGVLVTAGGHGEEYCFRSATRWLHIKGFVPVLQVKVSDTTGAGDAFLSGFLYSMVKVMYPTNGPSKSDV